MHYHIVGIAGAGMSAIANILLDQGHAVSGSDLNTNQLTTALQRRGVTIYQGHDAAYIAGADVVVATSAVPNQHPELLAAQNAGIAIYRRAQLWREWSQQRDVIAVAGTHGKTTTTAMIALMLERAGLNPGFLIGGYSPDLGTNARWGDPKAPFVIEADEYDRTFLSLRPKISVITNVEWDHVDIYPSHDEYEAAFALFAAQSQTCIVDESWAAKPSSSNKRWIRYGFGSNNDWVIGPCTVDAGYTLAQVRRRANPPLEVGVSLQVPGTHNMRNATAVLAVAQALTLNLAEASLALLDYHGTGRRFELKGEARGITVIDDYAHHPTEVRVNVEAARARFGSRRIVVYLQPHTYSRTRALLQDWPSAFAEADQVLVGAIYGAREQSTDQEEISDIVLAKQISHVHNHVIAVGGIDRAVSALTDLLQAGDVLLTMGAGDGYLVGERVLEWLKRAES
jgi:UDP-N-acetylmuramate--alanine ligase